MQPGYPEPVQHGAGQPNTWTAPPEQQAWPQSQPSYGQAPHTPPAYGPPSQSPAPAFGQAPQSAPPAYGPPQSAPPAYGAPQSVPPVYGQAPQSVPPAYGPPPQAPGGGYAVPPQPYAPAQPQVDLAQRAKREILVGLGLIAAGAAITICTYVADIPVYIVAWGPIVWGVVRVVRGVVNLVRAR